MPARTCQPAVRLKLMILSPSPRPHDAEPRKLGAHHLELTILSIHLEVVILSVAPRTDDDEPPPRAHESEKFFTTLTSS